jgi:hypothetical protein
VVLVDAIAHNSSGFIASAVAVEAPVLDEHKQTQTDKSLAAFKSLKCHRSRPKYLEQDRLSKHPK